MFQQEQDILDGQAKLYPLIISQDFDWVERHYREPLNINDWARGVLSVVPKNGNPQYRHPSEEAYKQTRRFSHGVSLAEADTSDSSLFPMENSSLFLIIFGFYFF